MGYELTKDYTLLMTDDGPVVFVDSPHKVEDASLTPARLKFKHGMSRTDVIRYMKVLDGKVSSIVSHEPVITPLLEIPLKDGSLTIEEVELNQLVMDGNEVFIDEFGLPIYCHSELSTSEGLKDLRYD